MRSRIGENKGKEFDKNAQRLGRLFNQGTDNYDIARQAVDMEIRTAKQIVVDKENEEENKR